MATTTLTLVSERWLDEVILQGTVADIGGASLSESFRIPAGLGDVAIMSVLATMNNIATVPVTATMPRGARFVIVSNSSGLLDYVGASDWIASFGDGAAFTRADVYVDPDALCLWRQDETLAMSSVEMDANAAPTGDLTIQVKCVRVRPVEVPSTPLQLVR